MFSRIWTSGRRSYVTQAAVQTAAKKRIVAVDISSPFLVDTFDRKHDYLRISLTEKCNLRCFYCMPEDGIELSPEGRIMTNAEVLRLARLFVRNGVTKIRLTGGEPTVRKGITELIQQLNELKVIGLKSLAMTTNGLALHRRLPQMVDNGLSHLNLSLDTLDPFKFDLITRRRGHDAVLKALDVALHSKLASVKLNVVVVKGLNDAEVLDFVKLTKDQPLSVRFIEFMPFTGNKWDQTKMVPSSELVSIIQAVYPTATRDLEEPNETARTWKIPGFKGTFGFISSMSNHFCSSCNRLRLTADGQIKVCLFDPNEVSLRDIMRQGSSDEELLTIVQRAISGKKEKHAGMNDIDVITNRPMILIGHPYNSYLNRWRRPYIQTPPHSTGAKMSCVREYSRLTHIDESGRANMVDVGDKQPTKRSATASGRIFITPVAYELVTKSYPSEQEQVGNLSSEQRGANKARRKGDTLTVAKLAAIMGAKQTSALIPLCHPLSLSKIDVKLEPQEMPEVGEGGTVTVPHFIRCSATVSCEGKTGVEMEALTAVSVGLLTVWDMLKAVAGQEMEITDIKVICKSGGRSGDFVGRMD